MDKEIREWWNGLDSDHQLIILAGGGFAFLIVVLFQPAVAIFVILGVILLQMWR